MVATVSIGPSALRNQGKGILKKAQKYCSKINLINYSFLNEQEYLNQLNIETIKMLKSFKLKKKPWGAARKALNLFFRNCLYNKYLCESYKINNIESFLEIPLDSAVAYGLKKRAKKRELPKWPGLKSLTKEQSNIYQNFAKKIAAKKKLNRIHLDMYLWLENR
jgi:hypothetical protein